MITFFTKKTKSSYGDQAGKLVDGYIEARFNPMYRKIVPDRLIEIIFEAAVNPMLQNTDAREWISDLAEELESYPNNPDTTNQFHEFVNQLTIFAFSKKPNYSNSAISFLIQQKAYPENQKGDYNPKKDFEHGKLYHDKYKKDGNGGNGGGGNGGGGNGGGSGSKASSLVLPIGLLLMLLDF